MDIKALLKEFMDSISPENRILIMTHDNPDPDALASAAALRAIIMEKTNKRASIAYGGIIGRAENLVMSRELELKLLHTSDINFDDYDVVALVDCQPEAGNSPVFKQKRTVTVTIDHHPKSGKEVNSDFVYLNERAGATSSILTNYIADNNIGISKKVATALFYGIKSETQNLIREATKLDKRAFEFLIPQIDNVMLGRIEFPPLPKEFFEKISETVKVCRLYGDVAVGNLSYLAVPDIVPQMADLLARIEEVQWSLVSGLYGGNLYLSIRTSNPDAQASKIMKKIVHKLGSGGGHGMMAGGRIPMEGKSRQEITRIANRIRSRFLGALKIKNRKGQPLFSKLGKKPQKVGV